MKNLFLYILLFSPSLLFCQNVGIGTIAPDTTLHIQGDNPSLKIQNNSGFTSTLEFGNTESGSYVQNGLIKTSKQNNLSKAGLEFQLHEDVLVRMNLNHQNTSSFPDRHIIDLNFRHPETALSTGDAVGISFQNISGARYSNIQHQNGALDISSRTDAIHLRSGYVFGEPSINLLMRNDHQSIIVDTINNAHIFNPPLPNSMLDVNGQIETNAILIRDGAAAGHVLTSDADGKASWTLVNSSGQLVDDDLDTKIQVEESPDEDILRFDVGGIQVATMDRIGLQLDGPGNGVYIGEFAGQNIDGGTSNTGIGQSALYEIVDGDFNVAIGQTSLYQNRMGSSNIAIGTTAGGSDTAAYNNVYLGHNAGNVPGIQTNRSGNVMIGHKAGIGEAGSNKLYIDNLGSSSPLIYGEFDNKILRANGKFQVFKNATQHVEVNGPRISIENSGHTTFLGEGAGIMDDFANNENTFIGYSAGETNTGFHNTLLGAYAGQITTAHDNNTFVGFGAGQASASSENVLMGVSAGGGNNNVTGKNVMLGFKAGQNSTVAQSVLIGHETGKISNGTGNTMIGYQVGSQSSTGSNNVLIGNQAGLSGPGKENVMIGSGAGFLNTNATGRNVFVGQSAGSLGNGEKNTYLGYLAGIEASGSNNIFIGNEAGVAEMGSNLLVIQNSISDAPLITGDFAADSVNIQGVMKVGDAIGSQLYVGKTLIESGGTNSLRFDAAVRPFTDNTNQLGGSSKRWTTVYAVNGTINTSDIRAKKNIKEMGYGLKDIMKLHPVSFHWKEENSKQEEHLGLIAQELNKIIPEVVEVPESAEDLYGVKYSDLIPVLIKSIQEQQLLIEKQQKQIDRLLLSLPNKQ